MVQRLPQWVRPDDSGFGEWFYDRLKRIHLIGLGTLAAIAVAAAIAASEPADRTFFTVISIQLTVLSIANYLVPKLWFWPWYVLPLAVLVGLRLHWAVFSSDEGIFSVLDTLPNTSTFARMILCLSGGLIATKPTSVNLERGVAVGLVLSGLSIGAIVHHRVGDSRGFIFAVNFSCLPLCMFLTRSFVGATVQPLWRELKAAKQRGGGEADEHEPPPPAQSGHLLPAGGAVETSGAEACGASDARRQVSMSDFEVQGFLGAGGSSQVHLVQRVGVLPTRLFALKSVRKDHSSARRVAEESRILQMLRHPFIVGLHYAFEDDLRLHLVLSYAGGGDLLARLEQHGPVAEPAARLCFAEIVSAMAYLHAQRVLYRDLKPDNVLLGYDGHVLLADFGVSKRLLEQQQQQQQHWQEHQSQLQPPHASRDGPSSSRASSSSSGDAATSTMVGSPAYMAPEVVLGREYSYAADWWSAGVLLHELLTNELPFGGVSIAEHFDALRRPGLCFRVKADGRRLISEAACDLIERLLIADASVRASSAGVQSDASARSSSWRASHHSPHASPAASSTAECVKGHAFFGALSWSQLDLKQLDAPFPPSLDGESSTHGSPSDSFFEYYESHNEASTSEDAQSMLNAQEQIERADDGGVLRQRSRSHVSM